MQQAEQDIRLHSQRNTPLRQLQRRFGDLPDIVIQTIEATTDTDKLDQWLDQILEAQSLADMAFPFT